MEFPGGEDAWRAEFFDALRTLPPLRVHTRRYPLQAAGQAMDDLRAGRFQGAAVLVPDAP